MICYIKDVEQLLLSLISAYYTAGPGMNNGSLNNSASIQILDIRIPRSTFLLFEEPAAISYSMWTFVRSIWAMRPGSTHSRSTAIIPVTLLNPVDFVVVCVERLIHALLTNLSPTTDELPVEQEVQQDNDPNRFADMFLRAAAQYVQEMGESSSTAEVGGGSIEGGPITFAPHHLLDPLQRQLLYGGRASMSGSSTYMIGSNSSDKAASFSDYVGFINSFVST